MKIVPLGELCHIKIGRTPSRANPNYWGGSHPWATISDLADGPLSTTKEGVTDLAVQEARLQLVAPGTLLYSFKLTIGKMAVASNTLYTNEAIAALVPRDPLALDSGYLRYALATINADAGASTAVKGRTLNSETLARLPVPLVPIEAQRRIAAQLTSQLAAVDSARSASAKRRVDAASLQTRTYEQAFADHMPFAVRPSNYEAPIGWTWHTLTDLARLETGHTPSRARDDWWHGDIPWIALPDIRRVDGRIAFETLETTNPEGIAHSAARVLPTDTVVMSRTASVGFVTRMGGPMATSQDFVNWVCGPDLDPEFLMHLLIRSRSEIRGLASGAIHKTVYFPTVRTFRVCVPSIAKQRRIAAELRERLASIDAIDSAIRAEQEAIDALPAALLRRAFGGLAA